MLFLSLHVFPFFPLMMQQCSYVMASYGVGPVAFSPSLSWVPPLLLAAAVYSTQTPAQGHHAN